MSIQQNSGKLEEKLSAKDIEEYLLNHPDFFVKHTQALSQISVPHQTGKAISLIEHQVDILRTNNKKLQKQLDDLVQIARENDKLSKQVFKLTLSLVGNDSLPAMMTIIEDALQKDFNVDAVCIRLIADPIDSSLANREEFIRSPDVLNPIYAKLVKDAKPICGRLKQDHLKGLFGKSAEKLGSLAILPLSAKRTFGLLAMGSTQDKRFQPGMGTVFLTQMSKIISKAFAKHIKPIKP